MASPLDSLNPGSSIPRGGVTLKIFADATAAEAAASLLKANGFDCWATTDDCGGMLPSLDAMHGVKLLVQPDDAEAARALLAASPIGDPTTASVKDSHTESPKPKLALLQITLGIGLGVLGCLLYQWTSRLGTHSYPNDSDGDGRPDEYWIFRNGILIQQARDRNYDGQLDAWDHYNSNSQRLISTADDNFDGKIDMWWYYTNGILASSSQDTDFNSTPDVTYFYQHELCIRGDWTPNGTNIVTLRQSFRNGVITTEQRDTNWDGSFDVTTDYDAFQNPVSSVTH